jgi:hypothetical protein
VGLVFFRAEDFRSAIAFLIAASNCLNRRLDEMAETF